jgi:hypothetical protein
MVVTMSRYFLECSRKQKNAEQHSSEAVSFYHKGLNAG